jgi:hypothetical protein
MKKMSEPYLSLDIRQSSIDECVDLLEQAICKETCFEEIERLFDILRDIEAENREAIYRENEDFERKRKEDNKFEKIKEFLITEKKYTPEQVTELISDFYTWFYAQAYEDD